MIKRNHVALAVFLGSAGQAAQAVSRLAVEQFIFELCEDVLLKAGYAGGIVSAGIDGERCAEAVANYLNH